MPRWSLWTTRESLFPLVGLSDGQNLSGDIGGDARQSGDCPMAHCSAAVELQRFTIRLHLHGCTLYEADLYSENE